VAECIAVTFAARYRLDLEGIADDTAGLPSGVSAEVQVTPPPAVKAVTPDEWRSTVQVLIDVGGVVGIGLLTNWLYDKLKGLQNDGRRDVVVDQSVHHYVRVFIGHFEVNGADRREVEGAVRDAIDAATSPTDIPPQLAPPEREPRTLTDTMWVDEQVEIGRRHKEEMAQLIERSDRRNRQK
jgi:hypothetical protein